MSKEEKKASPVAAVSSSDAKVGAAATTATRSKTAPTLFRVCAAKQPTDIAPYLDTQSLCRCAVNKQSLGMFSEARSQRRLHHFQTLVAQGQQQIAEVWLIAEKYQLPVARVEAILQSEIALALEEGCVIITMLGVQEKLAKLKLSDTKATASKTDQKHKGMMTAIDHKEVTTVSSTTTSTTVMNVSFLLTAKCTIPVMDYAGKETGESFVNLTAFQIPVIQNDTHMYRMMFPHYLPQQHARAQWEELLKTSETTVLNYTPRLMTDGTVPKQGEIYFRVKEDCLAYSVRTLYGEIVVDKTIPRDVLPPSSDSKSGSKSAPVVDLGYIQSHLSKILQYAAKQLDTDSEMGTLMTRGRCKMERLKHHLQTFVNNVDRWSVDECIEYFCMDTGGSHRYSPAHVLQEYGRSDRSFDPTPKFDESTLPRVPKYYDRTPIYPLRIYKSVVVVADIKAINTETSDPHSIFLERKNDGRLKLHWNKEGKLAASSFLDEKTVVKFISDREAGLDLPPAGRESRSRKLIALLLFKFSLDSDCNFGLGFAHGLIRGPYGMMILAGWAPTRVAGAARTDLAAVTALCKARSRDDLELLINDLYQVSPAPTRAPANNLKP